MSRLKFSQSKGGSAVFKGRGLELARSWQCWLCFPPALCPQARYTVSLNLLPHLSKGGYSNPITYGWKKRYDVINLLAPKKHPVHALRGSEGWTHGQSRSSDTHACSHTWCCSHCCPGESVNYLPWHSKFSKCVPMSFPSHIASTNLYTYFYQRKSCQQAYVGHPLNARGCSRHRDTDLNRVWPSRSSQSNEEKYMKVNLTIWIDMSYSRGARRGWRWEEDRVSARVSQRVSRENLLYALSSWGW